MRGHLLIICYSYYLLLMFVSFRCGLRGAYLETVGFSKEVLAQFRSYLGFTAHRTVNYWAGILYIKSV